MKKMVAFAAVAVSLVAAVAVAASRASRSSTPRIVSVASAALAAHQRITVLPSPGLYSATPHSGLVLVPKPVEPSLVIVPAASTQLDDCIVSPHLHLEPKK